MARIKTGSCFDDNNYIPKSIDGKVASSDGNIQLDVANQITNAINNCFIDMSIDEKTGIITINKKDGSTKTIDTLLEKVTTNFSYDSETQSLKLTLEDGSEQKIPISSFIKDYIGSENEVIQTTIDPTENKIQVTIKNNSISKQLISTDLISEIDLKATKEELSSGLTGKSDISHSHTTSQITEDSNKKYMTDAEKTKLSGIQDNANNYTHPATHSATEIMVGEKTLDQAIKDGDIGGNKKEEYYTNIIFDKLNKISGNGIINTDATANRGEAIILTGKGTQTISLFEIDATKIMLGKYAISGRIKTSNNTLNQNMIKIDIRLKKTGGSTQHIKTITFKGTNFENNNSYSWLTSWFDFSTQRELGDKIEFEISLVNSNQLTISIDYIMINHMMSAQYVLA